MHTHMHSLTVLISCKVTVWILIYHITIFQKFEKSVNQFQPTVVHYKIYLVTSEKTKVRKGKKIWHWDELPRSVGAKYAIVEERRNNYRKNEETERQWKQCPVVDVTSDRSKVWCYKGQYCILIWNVRPMNQGKLEVVKQEMARVNINILRISELKWTRMGEFDSDDHYIYHCRQEYLRRSGRAFIVNTRVLNSVLGCNLKTTERLLSISKANQSISQ